MSKKEIIVSAAGACTDSILKAYSCRRHKFFQKLKIAQDNFKGTL